MSIILWLVPLGYLAGSIPFGLLIAKASKGVDIRGVGSGNIGASNVMRAVGSWAAALTLALDMLKGWAPVALALGLGATETQAAGVAMAAFLGHLYPVFLGFRGGKGVATFLGVLFAVVPTIGLLISAVWLVVAALFRYSSLAALVAAAASPLLVWLLDGRAPYIILTAVLFSFILIRHRENMRRLKAGEEGKIGRKLHATGGDLPERGRLAS